MDDGSHESLGLDRAQVRLVEYDPIWPQLFETERTRLLHTCTDAIAIEHIGSTAVPGMPAKPILDIAMQIKGLVPAQALERLGYLARGEFGLPGRAFFTLGDPVRIHLHIVEPSCVYWLEWIRFRDLLRSDESVRHAYAEAKRALAEAYAESRPDYTAAKKPVIQSLMNKKESRP